MLTSVASDALGTQDAMVPVPIYRIAKDGTDITSTFEGRLVSLTIMEKRGFEADQLDIELDDADGLLELPSRGAKLRVAIGWKHSGLVDKGVYTVDEISHEGPPDRLVIRARSADLRSGLTTKRQKSYHGVTISDLVTLIAQRHNLTGMVASLLASKLLSHLDQTGESDASLLTRVAKMFDAIATVKADKLLFMKVGEAVTASGKPLAKLTIERGTGDRHHFSVADRESYDSVIAYYQDTRRSKKGQVIVTTVNEKENTTLQKRGRTKKREEPPVVEQTGNAKELRHTYANRTNAMRAARAEWNRIQRGVATFSWTLALGNPDLFPEVPVTVRGFKRQIDRVDWILSQVTHAITSENGYTSALELEIKATEVPDEAG